MAHVFVVNPTTFPIHLEYQFAGTTWGQKTGREIRLYADIARVRPGDRAYFYLLNEGFYGPFRIDPDGIGVWWDSLDPTFLQDQLGKRLIYRVKVVSDNTYPLAVSEWDALDRYLREPKRCLWSLVYKKLKAKRGCSMIFPWEDAALLKMIIERNEASGRGALQCGEAQHTTWNPASGEIEVVPNAFPNYDTPNPDHTRTPEDPEPELRKAGKREAYLQAFLTRSYGRFRDSEVVFGATETIRWVGNEVACGLGMQKIDLFVINERHGAPLFRVIELKKDPPQEKAVRQLDRYVEWTQWFIPGASPKNIQPVLLCRNLLRQDLPNTVADSLKRFNEKGIALPIKYIECVASTDRSAVVFREVAY